jgi:parvulin-like peptidyl-prolyl isomerase
MSQLGKWFQFTLLLAIGFSAGWIIADQQHKPQPLEDGNYIATVNEQGLSLDWFIDQMQTRGGLMPGQYQSEAQKRVLLDYLINEEVMYQKAIAEGVGDDPVVQQLVKKTTIDRYLTSTLQKQLDAVKVTEAEMKRHFNANQMQYNQPQRRRAAIIFAETLPDDNEQQKSDKRAKLESVGEELDELGDDILHFGPLALKYSDDRASMYQGGVIGWLIDHPDRKYKWGEPVIKGLFALEKPGDVSPIIETGHGFYLIRLVAAEEVREKTFNQVQQGIKNQLLQEKQKAVRENFITDLLDDANVIIHNEVLAQVPTLSKNKKQEQEQEQPPAMPSSGGAQ